MKRRACLAAALALPLLAHAADWVRVDVSDQHQHFYDRSKLAIDQDTIGYWRRVVFRAPQPARSGSARMAMYRESIDCARHTYRALGYLLYSQDGSVLDNVYTPEAAPEPIIPETVGDRFETLMCVFVEQAKLSQANVQAELPREASATQIRAQIERLEAELAALRAKLREAEAGSSASPSPAPAQPDDR
jgi:uncharacterized protein YceH (UPF0502 family)